MNVFHIFSSVSIVDIEQVDVSWDYVLYFTSDDNLVDDLQNELMETRRQLDMYRAKSSEQEHMKTQMEFELDHMQR